MSRDTPPSAGSFPAFAFDRHELAGALGDLGVLLPIGIALILLNGLSATAVVLVVGLFYLGSGVWFRTTVPVQPMKVVGAYAIARALPAEQISASGLWMAALLLFLAATGAIDWVSRVVPRATVRGVQLTVGVLLASQGVSFIIGTTQLQRARGGAEPNLSLSHLGPVPIGLVLGGVAVLLILILLENKRAPAALVVIGGGGLFGLLFSQHDLWPIHVGLHGPDLLPFGWPSIDILTLALVTLALPQAPMTVGNAVIAQADLTREYFGVRVAKRATPRAFAISMGLANAAAFLVGGMPLCHGAGGLAAHYRFGARTAGSNLMIGGLFVAVAILLGDEVTKLLGLLPLSVLGALLIFGGAQLALTARDLDERADFFVAVAILATSLATNLAIGFAVGIALALGFRYARLKI